MRRLTKIILLILCLIMALGCIPGTYAKGKLKIVCTSFPCYDFARAIAGDAAEVTLLIRPGMEVHSYEPTPTDILKIAGCDLFVYIGGESDVWVEGILDSLGRDVPRTARLMDAVELLEEEEKEGMTASETGEEGTEYDEHIWTSPENAVLMLEFLEESLREFGDFAASAQSYIAQIRRVDGEIRTIVDNAARKELIFADRFPMIYFTTEYAIDYYAAFPSCSTESEPSAATIAFLIEQVRRDSVPVLLVLEMSNSRTAQIIAEETGSEICTFYSMQNISKADFDSGETYVTLMERNLEVLRKAML